jgi:hypothetical protein
MEYIITAQQALDRLTKIQADNYTQMFDENLSQNERNKIFKKWEDIEEKWIEFEKQNIENVTLKMNIRLLKLSIVRSKFNLKD